MKFRLAYLMRFEQSIEAPSLEHAAQALRAFVGLHKFGDVIPLSVLPEGVALDPGAAVIEGGKKP